MRHRLLPVLTMLALALGALTGLTLTTAAPASAAAAVISIPTPAAGLGRIVTAPNGTIWFVERDAQKLGRILPGGPVVEYDLDIGSGYAQAEDVDVAPDNTVWVLFDSGDYIAHLRPDFSIIKVHHIGATQGAPGGGYPYGKQVRVAPDGRAWVTMSYDEQFATVVTDAGFTDVPNAPPCTGPLGEANDGSMWCSNAGSMFHLPGNAGIPVGVYASNPRAIAAGPVGDIWFASSTSDGPLTSPGDGYVGYLAGANPVRFGTGSRTGPNDLVRGPDNAMWFTSTGAAKGIGHVDAAGRGAFTQVGGYAPESLTFGPDGAVWFTDATNNVIVRVPTSDLQVTNVDPGAGSVFTVGQPAGGAAVPVKVKGKSVTVRAGRTPLTLTCKKGTVGGCKGKVSLVTAKAVKKPGSGKKSPAKIQELTSTAKVKIKAGKKVVVRPRLTRTGTTLVTRGKATKAVVLVNGTPVGTVKLRR